MATPPTEYDLRPSLDEVLRERRSIRCYTPREIPDELVSEILDLARYAPSSLDAQPWSFIVVRDLDMRQRLAEAKDAHCPPDKKEQYPAGFLATAPVIVAVCVDRTRAGSRERENGLLAAAYVLLGAHARGLGGVYMTAYQTDVSGLADEISRLLRLPARVMPVAILPLGFPAETPRAKKLRPLAELAHKEIFGEPWRDG